MDNFYERPANAESENQRIIQETSFDEYFSKAYKLMSENCKKEVAPGY